jgi:hypothetical protein
MAFSLVASRFIRVGATDYQFHFLGAHDPANLRDQVVLDLSLAHAYRYHGSRGIHLRLHRRDDLEQTTPTVISNPAVHPNYAVRRRPDVGLSVVRLKSECSASYRYWAQKMSRF